MAELLPHVVLLWEFPTPIVLGDYWDVDLVAVADFTGDRFQDFLISEHTTLFILPSRAEGGFGEIWVGAFYPVEDRPARFRVLTAIPFDLNADDQPDLIMSALIDEVRGAVFVLENQGVRFRPMITMPLASPTDWMALMDMTGDSKEDLILSQFDRTLGVTRIIALPRLGAFSFGEPIVVGEGRGWPRALADLDGDGHADLVLVHHDLTSWPDTGFLTVLWGRHTGFASGTLVKPSFGKAVHATAGDLTGDGQAEVVVATTQGVVVIQAVGERHFVERYAFDPGFFVKEVALADMDGDERLDAVLVANDHRVLAIWAGDGQGRFKGRVGEYVPRTGWIHRVSLVDGTGDGLIDIVLNYSRHLVLVVNGGRPRGTSSLPFSGAFFLTVGDVGSDGTVDIIVQGREGVEVLWNNGRGGLVRAALFEQKRPPGAAAVANGVVYVLVQEQRYRPAPPPRYIETFVSHLLHAYSPSGAPLGTWELGEEVFPLLAAADLDGDGKADLVGTRQGQDWAELWVLWGGTELAFYSLPGLGALLAAADSNGDRVAEIWAVCIAECAELRRVSFVEREIRISDPLIQLIAQPMTVSVGDVDGDSLADPVFTGFTVEVFPGPPVQLALRTVVLGMWLSSQGEAYALELDIARGQLPWPFHGLALGDFTGDGIGDLVFTTLGASGAVLLPGQGQGAFGEPRLLPTLLGPIAAADLDGNGQPELVGSTQGVNPYLWILWNGGGGQ
ncbi:MAG: VCBS repeat-containing protein [Candidatus Bipolaricaulaceae bacterium]